jgi:competence protein ComEA
MFKKISVKIGFTETEIKVLLFLLGIFLAGFAYIAFIKGGDPGYKEFDYSKEESSLLKSEDGDSIEEASTMKGEDSVRNQVLELKDRSYQVTAKKAPIEKSINLNSASKEQLMKIPGIGEKTADNILAYRGKNGKFKILEDIMNVKGIGESKYSKFKKYLFIK